MTSPSTDRRASSETLGVAVLVGMTILVTAGLGLGVVLLDQQQEAQTAQVDFTFIGDQLVVIYEDPQDRRAGSLYIDGPEGNVSWADLDNSKSPDDMVTERDNIRVGPNSAYGAKVNQDARYDLVYITPDGKRYVLASANASGSNGEGSNPSTGPDGPGGPGSPSGPGG
ncbi:hypothetical protein GRX03_08015 [Halovenus sp. WSH3]|uniref:Type IV pilin n=1 Tax=Halovenus carboxidivorans TaxID=2692199 RepID=A0A6B0T075_9EURY|nr:hypothetical protein [Halovenus carboxidivorans]MXR51548.1 hypothetical protein [Halovenus carboxidivorans]